MKKKKAAAMILSVITLLSVGFGTYAAETSDTSYSFYFTTKPMKTDKYSESRRKTNRTSSYMSVSSGKNLSTGVTFSMVGGNYQDVGSSHVTFRKSGCALISQETFERHIYNTRLKGHKVVPSAYVQAFGLWSPDSNPAPGCRNV